MSTSHSVIPHCSKQMINILQTSFRGANMKKSKRKAVKPVLTHAESVRSPVAEEVHIVVDAELVDKDDGDGESRIGDAEVIADDQEEDKEESDAGGDLDVLTRERI